MSTRSLFFALSSFAALSFALVGCAADVAEEDMVEEAESDLSAAGRALIGSYADDSGAFKGLVLTSKKVGQRNVFFADVDTGVRCIKAPCPSSERIEGTFTAGSKTITLRSTTASGLADHLLGKYNYVKQGDKLTLFRKGFTQSLAKQLSYCAAPTDCESQDLIHVMCVGSWSCTATNTCAYSCGAPAPAPSTSCYASDDCGATEYCTTEDGVCNSSGMLAVCSGTCEARKPAATACYSSEGCGPTEYCTTEDGVCNPSGMLAVCSGTCAPYKFR